jgi:hypothetical protein
MEYGATAHNRIVCASEVTPLGLRKPQSGLHPFVRFSVGTFFCAMKPLRGFFIGLSNRRKQPERYTQCALKLIGNIKYS